MLNLSTPERRILFAGVGILPPEVERELSSADLEGALGGARLPDATHDALRRLHLAQAAEGYAARGGSTSIPVNPRALLEANGIRVNEVADRSMAVTFVSSAITIDTSGSEIRRRFMLAHACGHHALRAYRCEISGQGDMELDATAFASFLLSPRGDLLHAVHAEGWSADPWAADAVSGVVEQIAERFGMPSWLAARRLGEEGLLAEIVEIAER